MYALIAYIGDEVFWVGRFGNLNKCLHEALMATWRVGIEFHCMELM